MNPKALPVASIAAGALLILIDLSSGTPSNAAGSALIGGAILIAGALIALAIRGR